MSLVSDRWLIFFKFSSFCLLPNSLCKLDKSLLSHPYCHHLRWRVARPDPCVLFWSCHMREGGRAITDGCGVMGGEKDSWRGGTREHIKKLWRSKPAWSWGIQVWLTKEGQVIPCWSKPSQWAGHAYCTFFFTALLLSSQIPTEALCPHVHGSAILGH